MDRKEILRLGNLIKFEEYEFRHPDCEGMSFGKREGAINYLKLNTEEEIQKELKRVKEIDTRITMGELLDKLNELEGEVWNDHISLITFGPEPWGYKDRFPWFYNHIAVYMVKGGSEGHYLHIDLMINGTHKGMFLGKGFNDVDVLYESTKRISLMFGNGILGE